MQDSLFRWTGSSWRRSAVLLTSGMVLCLAIFVCMIAYSSSFVDQARRSNFLGKQAILWGALVAVLAAYMIRAARRSKSLRRLVTKTQPVPCSITIRGWIPSGVVPVFWADLRDDGEPSSSPARWSIELGDIPVPLTAAAQMPIANEEIPSGLPIERSCSGLVYADGSRAGHVIIVVADCAALSKDEVLLEDFAAAVA